MAEKNEQGGTSHVDLLKALVDNALGGDVHPDQRATMEAWRDQHTTDEEKERALTDDERAALAVERANKGGTEARPTTADESASGEGDDQPGTKGAARDDDKPRSGTRKT